MGLSIDREEIMGYSDIRNSSEGKIGMNQKKRWIQIQNSIIEMEEEDTVALCERALADGCDPQEIITNGLIPAMDQVGKLYEEEEYFLPEVLLCADAMNAGLEVVKPHLVMADSSEQIKVVLGVVQGDTHDIGKTLVKIMMESAGMEVFDLGRDVALEQFVEVAIRENAQVIAMSTLMTTTMMGMKKVVEMLIERGIRDQMMVIIGGGPISEQFAQKIGADHYAKDANETVRLIREKYGVS